MDAIAFLEKESKSKRQPVYALFGDEDFLKSRCRDTIVKNALGDADAEFAVSTYNGEEAEFSAVRNDLETLPFLAPVRIVVLERADEFVTEHRSALEQYAAAPSKVGVLILEVKTFPETTKLAKALPDAAKISCKAPSAYKLQEWCAKWCKTRHGKSLSPDAAGYLIELVGPQLGLLDKELEKLSAAIGSKERIDPDDVDRLVSRSKEANVFGIFDAVGEGQPARALTILGQLLDDGEVEFAIVGAMTAQLRKIANIGRNVSLGLPIQEAMTAAGVPTFPDARAKTERLVRHLGRRRLEALPGMLVELNLGLRGESRLPERLQIERFLVQLARPRDPA